MKKTSKNKLTYIPNAKNTCISSEEAQHVYEAIKLEKPVLPLDKALKVHRIPEVINPYEAALSQELDVHGNVDPLGCAECNNLRLSVLSTELSYKVESEKGSFQALSNSHIYSTFHNNLDYFEDKDLDYCDRFEEVTAHLSSSTLFNESVDITTTYLGRLTPESQVRSFNNSNEITIKHNCVTEGNLMNGTKLRILFDTGATRSYMSKGFYMSHPELHTLPKFASTCKGILVGNGQMVSVMFIIPVIISMQGHIFEIYTTICDMHEGLDLVFGMQNMVETEGEMSARNGCFRFVSRSIPIFPPHSKTVPPSGKAHLRVRAPFCEPLCGQGLTKFFAADNTRTDTILLRLLHNQGLVVYENIGAAEKVFDPQIPIGIMDLCSLGYFRVTYRDLVQRVESKCQMFHYYKEIPEATLILLRACPALSRHQQKPYSDPYPWLDKEDQHRHMSDRQILYD